MRAPCRGLPMTARSRSQAIAACTGASSSILTVDASRRHQWPVQSDGEGPSFGAGALYDVRGGQMTRTCQGRSVCCLYFKSSARYFCARCSISPESDGLERNRSWVTKQAALGAAIDGRAKLETVIRDEHRSQRRSVQSHRRRVLRSRLAGEQSAMPRNEDLAQSREVYPSATSIFSALSGRRQLVFRYRCYIWR